MTGNLPEALNLNQLFLKLSGFIHILGQRATIIWEGLCDHLTRKEIVTFKINVFCISLYYS